MRKPTERELIMIRRLIRNPDMPSALRTRVVRISESGRRGGIIRPHDAKQLATIWDEYGMQRVRRPNP